MSLFQQLGAQASSWNCNLKMSSAVGLRFLRPTIQNDLSTARRAAYLRFFSTSHSLLGKKKPQPKKIYRRPEVPGPTSGLEVRAKVQERIDELKAANALNWPRIKSSKNAMTIAEFKDKYDTMLAADNPEKSKEYVVLRGRARSLRIAGKALVFVDIAQDGKSVQVMLNRSNLGSLGVATRNKFEEFYHVIRRGDIISVYGSPHCSNSGELSVNALELPEILSPSLGNLPRELADRETRIRNRHVDLLINKRAADTIRVRSAIIQHLREFLLKDKFMEVQTPLITGQASGAIARPFTTVATEFSDKTLALRIAPEIWLKRLVIGGMDRVFEIGPAFRNEGLDATHNPEYTTCEFYKSYADIEELISMTESLLGGIAKLVTELQQYPLKQLDLVDLEKFTAPFKRIDFIPAVEEGLRQKLPDLAADDAEKKLMALFEEKDIKLPSSPTLPRLLDKLASIYIEPDCIAPTFIMHHPAAMAPLAKSFHCPKTNQLVSARAELFVDQRELANMYEEENSPFAQREKFIQQSKWRDEENTAVSGVDESYLEALEWGLPPTGGWGCGVDRLVMLFSGAKRISDVLAFGSLRNVVNLGKEAAPVVDANPRVSDPRDIKKFYAEGRRMAKIEKNLGVDEVLLGDASSSGIVVASTSGTVVGTETDVEVLRQHFSR